MPRAQVPKDVLADREARAVALRHQGYTQAQIAEAIGVDQGTVSRILSRVTARVLKGMADYVAERKVAQVEQLEWMASEASRAWESSKKRRSRVVRKTDGAGDGGPGQPAGQMIEVVDRDGDPNYLRAAMAALAEVRKILGLDVMAAENEGVGTIAQMSADLFARGRKYEERRANEGGGGHPVGPGGPAAGGAGEVPGGPEPVQ